MLELYVIRHGLAGKCLEDKAKDEARPLKKSGKEQIKGLAKALKDRKVFFDIILTSPLLRAKESAEIVNEYCGKSKKVITTDLLKPESTYARLIKLLNSLKKSKKVAIVGHEPFLSSFVSYSIAKSNRSLLTLKKGGILLLKVDDVVVPGRCVLTWLMEPEHLLKPDM